MSDGSAIEWTDATWNPVRARRIADGKMGWHCSHASEGCRNSYAEGFNRRLGTGLDYKPGHLGRDVEIVLDEAMLLAPLKWRKARTIFVGSMTDLFADFVTDVMRDRIFAVMVLCPQHRFQLLTKRADRMRAYLAARADAAGSAPWRQALYDIVGELQLPAIDRLMGPAINRSWNEPLPNVWMGVSVEDQAAADARIPDLLATPAAVRFLSCEPLLGAVGLSAIDVYGDHEVLPLGAAWLGRDGEDEIGQPRIDWVIAGGESGRGARPMHPDWARGLRDQCAAAGVPFFFKQWGEWLGGGPGRFHASDCRELKGWGDDRYSARVGKKKAGRQLDGVTHDAMPGVLA